jgi:hypothetical protein
MTPALHRPRQATAEAEKLGSMVDLLIAHVDRAYVTAGQPGAIAAVRDLFQRMDPAALTGLVHELGLAAEPVKEGDPGERRPE